MNFAPDTFESVHRRKKLAAWLATLRGPKKQDLREALAAHATILNTANVATWATPKTYVRPSILYEVTAMGGGGGGAGSFVGPKE